MEMFMDEEPFLCMARVTGKYRITLFQSILEGIPTITTGDVFTDIIPVIIDSFSRHSVLESMYFHLVITLFL